MSLLDHLDHLDLTALFLYIKMLDVATCVLISETGPTKKSRSACSFFRLIGYLGEYPMLRMIGIR